MSNFFCSSWRRNFSSLYCLVATLAHLVERYLLMIKYANLMMLCALYFSWVGTAPAAEPDRTIEIHALRYKFTPSEITVKKGETVRLRLFSDDVTHSLLIKDLAVNQTITKGKPSEVILTPQQVGDFHGQCGRFCGSGHGQMQIVVHVTGN